MKILFCIIACFFVLSGMRTFANSTTVKLQGGNSYTIEIKSRDPAAIVSFQESGTNLEVSILAKGSGVNSIAKASHGSDYYIPIIDKPTNSLQEGNGTSHVITFTPKDQNEHPKITAKVTYAWTDPIIKIPAANEDGHPKGEFQLTSRQPISVDSFKWSYTLPSKAARKDKPDILEGDPKQAIFKAPSAQKSGVKIAWWFSDNGSTFQKGGWGKDDGANRRCKYKVQCEASKDGKTLTYGPQQWEVYAFDKTPVYTRPKFNHVKLKGYLPTKEEAEKGGNTNIVVTREDGKWKARFAQGAANPFVSSPGKINMNGLSKKNSFYKKLEGHEKVHEQQWTTGNWKDDYSAQNAWKEVKNKTVTSSGLGAPTAAIGKLEAVIMKEYKERRDKVERTKWTREFEAHTVSNGIKPNYQNADLDKLKERAGVK